jgi:cysteine desulfurase
MPELFEVVPGAALVSIQWANSETGVLQDVHKVAAFCNALDVPFHSDCAQAFGKVALDLETSIVGLASVTAHKLHGPPGVGAIYAKNRGFLKPRQRGGTQEHGIRPGTENLPGIVGFGHACELRRMDLASSLEKMRLLRDDLESRILDAVPEATVNGAGAERVCNTTNIRFGDLDGQAMVAQLDALGVRCSQTSACTNQRPEPSHVLRAMGLTEDEAWSSIRFSVSEFSTQDDVVGAVEAIKQVVCNLTRTRSLVRSRAS